MLTFTQFSLYDMCPFLPHVFECINSIKTHMCTFFYSHTNIYSLYRCVKKEKSHLIFRTMYILYLGRKRFKITEVSPVCTCNL